MRLKRVLAEDESYGVLAGLRRVSAELQGVEKYVGFALLLPWALCVSYWLGRCVEEKNRAGAIDAYVCTGALITIVTWWAESNWLLLLLCTYLSLSSLLALLQVVFLSKIMGPLLSAERSLLLFLINVVQFVFMFAGWYKYVGMTEGVDALFNSIQVLATIGYPPDAKVRVIVMLQVASNMLLLAVFLSHLIGKIGDLSKSPSA